MDAVSFTTCLICILFICMQSVEPSATAAAGADANANPNAKVNPKIKSAGLHNNVTAISGIQYSAHELKLIKQFRILMDKQLNRDFMKTDDFLIKWLRATFMNIDDAKQMLERSLRWRKEKRIDGILDENFGPVPKSFNVNIGGHDKDGRPLFIVYFGAWDIRKAVISRQGDRVQRYLSKQLESAAKNIRDASAASPYHNITNLVIIFDGTGYNLRQHGCLTCIPEYVTFINNLESNYPLMTHKIIMLNSPTVFQHLYRVILPLFHPETAKGVAVYGVDRNEWLPELLKFIPLNQLPKRLGGTRHT